MQHLIESGTDIETLAKKKVDKERGLIRSAFETIPA